MGPENAKAATDTIAHSIDFIIEITMLFFLMALLLFVVISLLQIYLERRRRVIEAKKLNFIDRINLSLFDHTVLVEAKSNDDKIALADAILEVNNFTAKEDSHTIKNSIEENKLAIFLCDRYQKSYFRFRKIFYFNKMIYLQYPPYKSFFLKKMKNRRFSKQKEALYGFATLCNSQKDLEIIASVMTKHIKYRGMSYIFGRFIFEEAFKHVSPNEIEQFAKTVKRYNHITAKSIMQAIADTKTAQLKHCIIDIYKLYQNNEDFIIRTIKILSASKYPYCQVIKNSYLHGSHPVRRACAQHAFELCGKSALDFIYLYFTDKEDDVRETILASAEAAGLNYTDILDVTNKKLLNASGSMLDGSTTHMRGKKHGR